MSFTTNVGQNWPAIAAVIAFFVAGLGYLRWAKSQAAVNTIKLLEANANAQNVTIARLEGDNRALTAKLDEQTERLALLQSLVTGVPAWDRLERNYATLEKAITSLDPVIAVFQKHVDRQDEMYEWMKELRSRAQ